MPPLQQSVAACLASILKLDLADVPVPEAEHPEPWTVWRNWLAQRGLGLVPISDPATFNWPGPWIAVLRADDGEGQVGVVAFGAPPGIAWSPLDGTETFDRVELGYVIAPADVALWAPAPKPSPGVGTVEAVLIAADAEAPMVRIDGAAVRAGQGLEGDRYFRGEGTFSEAHDRGHDLTLIQVEMLDDVDLHPEDARRNVVTRGIDLHALVGRHFTIGEVKCFGQRLCEPCAHLERLTANDGKPGSLPALVHKGGLRVDVLSDGEIRVGHKVAVA